VTTLREAYDSSATAWGDGPDRVFGTLAEALLARGPRWAGLRVVDVGAGTGTATRRLAAAGAQVVAVDVASEMLAVAGARCACTSVVGDACALPLQNDATGAAVLGFVLNHLSRPEAALREAARVVRPGGWVLASTWSREDAHPVREVVQRALLDRGWQVPEWYQTLKKSTTPLSDTAAALGRLARSAGLAEVDTSEVTIPVPAPAGDLLGWRLGMPHTAPFVDALAPAEQRRLWQELQDAAASLPPLVCRLSVLVSRVS
jgi:ubiquinone/menaquinone biosynthesis C-methylase UbiE